MRKGLANGHGSVLQEIEREDQAWEDLQRKRKPSRTGKNPSAENENDTTTWQPSKIEEQKTDPKKPRSNAPRGFY